MPTRVLAVGPRPKVARMDARGRFLEVSEAFAAAIGRSPRELLGAAWVDTLQPTEQARAADAALELRERGRADLVTICVRGDGSPLPVCLRAVACHDRTGLFVGNYLFIRDVSPTGARLP